MRALCFKATADKESSSIFGGLDWDLFSFELVCAVIECFKSDLDEKLCMSYLTIQPILVQ